LIEKENKLRKIEPVSFKSSINISNSKIKEIERDKENTKKIAQIENKD